MIYREMVGVLEKQRRFDEAIEVQAKAIRLFGPGSAWRGAQRAEPGVLDAVDAWLAETQLGLARYYHSMARILALTPTPGCRPARPGRRGRPSDRADCAGTGKAVPAPDSTSNWDLAETAYQVYLTHFPNNRDAMEAHQALAVCKARDPSKDLPPFRSPLKRERIEALYSPSATRQVLDRVGRCFRLCRARHPFERAWTQPEHRVIRLRINEQGQPAASVAREGRPTLAEDASRADRCLVEQIEARRMPPSEGGTAELRLVLIELPWLDGNPAYTADPGPSRAGHASGSSPPKAKKRE